MTTQYAAGTISETDALAFLTKLNAWAQDLSSTERVCLEALLVRAAAADDADVSGFLMRAQPYEPGVRPAPSPDGSGSAGTPLNLSSLYVLPGFTLARVAEAGGLIVSDMLGLP